LIWRDLHRKEGSMKKTIMAICMLALVVFAAGCNTINGMGRDVERAGEKVQSLSKQ
jgi:predicted small secreted protein